MCHWIHNWKGLLFLGMWGVKPLPAMLHYMVIDMGEQIAPIWQQINLGFNKWLQKHKALPLDMTWVLCVHKTTNSKPLR